MPPVGSTEMLEFMMWPNVKKFTFITLANYFKTRKEEEMNRADVYRHMQNVKDNERQIFVTKKPYETQVWRYVDALAEEGLIQITEKFVVANRNHYKFKLTDKGVDLHRRISFALNFGPDDISKLIDSSECRGQLAGKIDDLLSRSFPAPSAKNIKEVFESLKKERQLRERRD